MTKTIKNKIFALLAALTLVFAPLSVSAVSAESENGSSGGFASTAEKALSMVKEDTLALAADASSGAAIVFESIKNFFDSFALTFYKIVSALFIRGDNATEKQVAVKTETPPAATKTAADLKNIRNETNATATKETVTQIPLKLPTFSTNTSVNTSVPRSSSSASPQAVVERVVERVVEKTVSSESAVSQTEFSTALEQLKNKVFSEIYRVSDSSQSTSQALSQAISLTNKIDNLSNVTISNSTFSGTISGITDSMIPNDITVSNYLPLSGGTLTGALTTYASATSTFAGQSLFSFIPSITHTFSSWATGATGANPLGAALIINPASATADSNLFSVSVNNSAKFLVDAEGDIFANSLTAAGGVTLSTTTASTFSVENNATLGDSTTTDKTYFNSRIGTSLVPTANNALDLGDTTNGLAWRTGIFGTSVGIGTTSPYAALSVVGETVSTYFTATSTTATSTFAGNIYLSSASSSIKFGNNWRIIPTVATTSEITVYDSTGNAAFVFDEN